MTLGSFLSFFRRLMRCERGDPIIEFIFIVPLMLVLGFGVMEIGRILWYQHFITKGVRDGTRYLTRVPLEVGACGALPATAVTTAIGLALNGAYWGNPDPDTVTVTLEAVPNNAAAFYGPNPLCMVRMRAQVVLDFGILGAVLGMFVNNFDDEVTFTISNQARHIGQ